MMTSVTISDDLRKKLKRLAAKYDTNQAEIIRRSLELLERYETLPQSDLIDNFLQNIPDSTRRQQIQSFLSESKQEFERTYPDLAKLSQTFHENAAILSEVTVNKWDLPFNE